MSFNEDDVDDDNPDPDGEEEEEEDMAEESNKLSVVFRSSALIPLAATLTNRLKTPFRKEFS